MTARKGNWMLLRSGREFWPLDPRVGDFVLDDIAHALAHICRFNGHCEFFYSVLEHSIAVAECTPEEYRLEALLHDAAEAYIGDMVLPLKALLPEYRAIERGIEQVLAAQFALTYPWPAEVKAADIAVLKTERAYLMPPGRPWDMLPAKVKPAVQQPRCLTPAQAIALFHERYQLAKAARPPRKEAP